MGTAGNTNRGSNNIGGLLSRGSEHSLNGGLLRFGMNVPSQNSDHNMVESKYRVSSGGNAQNNSGGIMES